jgi:hypothetical protein
MVQAYGWGEQGGVEFIDVFLHVSGDRVGAQLPRSSFFREHVRTGKFVVTFDDAATGV